MGLGAVSFEHIEKLRRLPDVEIVALCDVSETLTRAVAERFGVGSVYTDYGRLLEETRPDAIHVLTPPQTHAALVLRAIDAGAHVLVEKPAAPTWDEYVEMRDAAVRSDRLLVENYNWLFMDVVQRVVDEHRNGGLGEVVSVEVSFGGVMGDGSGPLADRDLVHFAHELPGGALQNFASHPVSIALAFMAGCRGVGAARRTFAQESLGHDELLALLAGERSCGVVSVTSQTQPGAFTLSVRGTAATAEVDLYNGRVYFDRSGPATAKLTNGVRHGFSYIAGTVELVGRVLTSTLDHYQGLERLLSGFYRAIANGGSPPVSLAQMDDVNRVMAQLFSPEHQL